MYCDVENCKEAKKALETDKEELKKNVQHVEARLKKKKTRQAGEKKCRNLEIMCNLGKNLDIWKNFLNLENIRKFGKILEM